jgi:hypothetical protein
VKTATEINKKNMNNVKKHIILKMRLKVAKEASIRKGFFSVADTKI